MRFPLRWSLVLALFATACAQAAPSGPPAAAPGKATNPSRYSLQYYDDCPQWEAVANSEVHSNSGDYDAHLAVDREPDFRTGRSPNDTHWSPEGGSGALLLRTYGRPYIGSLRIKVNEGSFFRVFVDGQFVASARGEGWQPQEIWVGREGSTLRIEGESGPLNDNFMVFDVSCGRGGGTGYGGHGGYGGYGGYGDGGGYGGYGDNGGYGGYGGRGGYGQSWH